MSSTPHGVRFDAHRPVVMGRNGMVCAGHPLAAQAGVSILQRGGNAFDAAIATAAALGVVEPLMSGIGGDGFIMAYRAEDDSLRVCNGTGAAPYAATLERYRQGIPMKGILSVSVPGLLNAWLDTHEAYGVLPLGEVLAPAIRLAEDGFPVSHYLSGAIASDSLLCEFPTSRAIFTRSDTGGALLPGDILRQSDLARTLSTIAQQSRDAFYRGSIGEAIVRFSEEQGGLLTMADLNDCSARWQEPISTNYGDYTVYEAPPNSSGHILLQELNVIRQYDMASLGFGTAESIHLMVEAKKMAFADREAYVADPDYIDVPVAGMLSEEYARERAQLIDRYHASSRMEAGDPWRYQPERRPATPAGVGRRGPRTEEEDTTCFVVADRAGNAVCQLQSIQSGWGSSLVAGNTGILLNNRMTYWHLEPDHVDCLQPGKRVRHTMNPVMVFRSSDSASAGARRLTYVLGTPGADCQVQSNMQIITNLVDHGMTVQEAVEAPRWKHVGDGTESTVPHTAVDQLLMESRFDQAAIRQLRGMGHPVHELGAWDGVTGREMALYIDPDTGALHGAADPRYDGYAIGY
ncbi:MAG: gamma-glutamyltransferase [Chloroflexi bacterium]|nr:gamma-glutamyltransferase [Chloroflexota bacterium]